MATSVVNIKLPATWMNDIYSDIDIQFNLNKKTGDVNRKRDEESIKQSLWCLLKTNFYDRKWHPEIGSYFPKMLFSQSHPAVLYLMQKQITTLINNYEPRVSLNGVAVYYRNQHEEDLGIVTVEIAYSTLELGNKVAVFHVERTR